MHHSHGSSRVAWGWVQAYSQPLKERVLWTPSRYGNSTEDGAVAKPSRGEPVSRYTAEARALRGVQSKQCVRLHTSLSDKIPLAIPGKSSPSSKGAATTSPIKESLLLHVCTALALRKDNGDSSVSRLSGGSRGLARALRWQCPCAPLLIANAGCGSVGWTGLC